jgi:GNAT superfamily N-acetyltransferase
MPIAIRHRDDVVPKISPLPGLAILAERDASRMATLQGRSESEMQRRFDEGHRAYVAYFDGVPAAWGWVATSSAAIGELNASFHVQHDERYLWNFVTLAAFRGRGIYPRLLSGILEAEAVAAERFWVAYAPENHASGAGIRKAGFTVVAELSFDDAGRPVVKDIIRGGGGDAARLLGLPEIEQAVAQCWRCVRAGHDGSACRAGTCSCDYQRPQERCAA